MGKERVRKWRDIGEGVVSEEKGEKGGMGGGVERRERGKLREIVTGPGQVNGQNNSCMDGRTAASTEETVRAESPSPSSSSHSIVLKGI